MELLHILRQVKPLLDVTAVKLHIIEITVDEFEVLQLALTHGKLFIGTCYGNIARESQGIEYGHSQWTGAFDINRTRTLDGGIRTSASHHDSLGYIKLAELSIAQVNGVAVNGIINSLLHLVVVVHLPFSVVPQHYRWSNSRTNMDSGLYQDCQQNEFPFHNKHNKKLCSPATTRAFICYEAGS
jgi:hypothetical protein